MNYLRRYRDLLAYRVVLEAKKETRQLYIGLLWWIIEPATQVAILYLVFGVLLKRGGPGFIGSLIVGFLFWRWMDNSSKKALQSMTSARPIITQVKLQAWLFPVSDILSVSLRFLVILAMLILFAVVYSGQFGAAYMALPALLALNLVFLLALGTALSLLPPFFPDSRKIIDNIFTLLFFASGIFYDISKLDSEFASYMYLNPIAGFIAMYRGIMLYGEAPDLDILLRAAIATAIALAVAILACRAADGRLAKALLR